MASSIPFFVVPIDLSTHFYAVQNERSTNPWVNATEYQFAGMTYRSNGNSPAPALYLDFGQATQIDFVGLLGANAIPTTEWRVYGADVLATIDTIQQFNSSSVPFIAPATTGRALYNSFLEPMQARRAWEIQITVHTGDFEAAFLVMGKKVSPSRWYDPEWEAGPDDQSTISFTRQGVPDIAPGRMLRKVKFTMSWLTEDEYESSILPMLLAAGKTNPIYCCFDPAATTYRQSRTYFGWLTDVTPPRKKAYNRYEKSFEILSMI